MAYLTNNQRLRIVFIHNSLYATSICAPYNTRDTHGRHHCTHAAQAPVSYQQSRSIYPIGPLGALHKLRTLFAHYNQRGWYRLMADVRKVKLPNVASPSKALKKQLAK
jgi:hypothetical protein